MQNHHFFLLFLVSLSLSCSPKVSTISEMEDPAEAKTDKVKTNFKSSEFENFTYEIETDGKYVETVLDKNPEPLDGEDKFFMAMYRSISYPPIARENGVVGTVKIRVVLDEFGQLESSEIISDIGAGCGKEALKAVRAGFETPVESAMLGGNRVKVRFVIPVHFKLG